MAYLNSNDKNSGTYKDSSGVERYKGSNNRVSSSGGSSLSSSSSKGSSSSLGNFFNSVKDSLTGAWGSLKEAGINSGLYKGSSSSSSKGSSSSSGSGYDWVRDPSTGLWHYEKGGVLGSGKGSSGLIGSNGRTTRYEWSNGQVTYSPNEHYKTAAKEAGIDLSKTTLKRSVSYVPKSMTDLSPMYDHTYNYIVFGGDEDDNKKRQKPEDYYMNTYYNYGNGQNKFMLNSIYNNQDIAPKDIHSINPNNPLDLLAGIKYHQNAYNEAKLRGDTAAMENHHKGAEGLRGLMGFSGGVDGSQYIPLDNPYNAMLGGYLDVNNNLINSYMNNNYNILNQQRQQEEDYLNYMNYMQDKYDKMADDLASQIDASINLGVSKYENQIDSVNSSYDDAARQAYIQSVQAKDALPQELAALGATGGASESSQIALSTNYQNNLAQINKERLKAVNNIRNAIAELRATGDIEKAKQIIAMNEQALNQYNAMYNNYLNMQNNRFNTELNLYNNISSMQMNAFDRYMDIYGQSLAYQRDKEDRDLQQAMNRLEMGFGTKEDALLLGISPDKVNSFLSAYSYTPNVSSSSSSRSSGGSGRSRSSGKSSSDNLKIVKLSPQAESLKKELMYYRGELGKFDKINDSVKKGIISEDEGFTILNYFNMLNDPDKLKSHGGGGYNGPEDIKSSNPEYIKTQREKYKDLYY